MVTVNEDFQATSGLLDVDAPASVLGLTPNQIVWRRLRRDRSALLGIAIIAFVTLAALAAPLIAQATGHGPDDYFVKSMASEIGIPKGPTLDSADGAFLLGVDRVSRDLLVRIVYGLRSSLIVAVLTTLLATALGTAVGLVAGYYRGRVDAIASRITDLFFTLPSFLLFLGIQSACGGQPKGQECLGGLLKPGIPLLVSILGFFGWAYLARVVRGQVLSLREREFIQAAQSLGAGDLRIMVQHILPNVVGQIIVIATLSIPGVVLAESALGYLGLGLPASVPSLGVQVAMAEGIYRAAWWTMAFPGAALVLLTVGFNVLGDGLRDALDPRAT